MSLFRVLNESSTSCKDPIFGTMNYKHNWNKSETFTLLGKKYRLEVAVQAYNGKPINSEEQKSYKYIKENWPALQKPIARSLLKFAKECNQKVYTEKDLSKIIEPRIILFQLNGNTYLLFDCAWDAENDISVQIYPDIKLVNQQCFL